MSSNNFTYEFLINALKSMISSSSNLKNGYQFLRAFEFTKNFYFYLLKCSFDENFDINLRKLASLSLKTFIQRNWNNDDSLISNDEKKQIMNELFNMIQFYYNKEYYFKNFIAKIIGIIISKEINNIEYLNYLEILLNEINKLSNNENFNEEQMEFLLKIIINILNESDDTFSNYLNIIFPPVMKVFNISRKNTKIREKCLIIISETINKITYADGTNDELLENQLPKKILNPLIILLNNILSYNNKFIELCDLKKYCLKILDIMINDMKYFSKKNDIFNKIKDVIFNSTKNYLEIYINKEIINQNIIYSDEELNEIKENKYHYERGYESENEDEIYGLTGMIIQLGQLIKDIIENDENFNENNYNLLIFSKLFILIPYVDYELFNSNGNEFILREYSSCDDNKELINLRKIWINIIISILDDNYDLTLNFIQLIINEMNNGLDLTFYNKVFENQENLIKLINNKDLISHIQESNFFILGCIIKKINSLLEQEKINIHYINGIINNILNLLKNSGNQNNIIIPRAIWVITIFNGFYNLDLKKNIFNLFTHIFLIQKNIVINLVICESLYNISKEVNISLVSNNGNECIDFIFNSLLKLIYEENIIYIFQILIAFIHHNINIVEYIIIKYLNVIVLELFHHMILKKEHFNLFLELIEEISKNISKYQDNLFQGFLELMIKALNNQINGEKQFLENLIITDLDVLTLIIHQFCKFKIRISNNLLDSLNQVTNKLCEIFSKSNEIENLLHINSFLKYCICYSKINSISIEIYFFHILDENVLDTALIDFPNILIHYYIENNNLITQEMLNKLFNKFVDCQSKCIIHSILFLLNLLILKNGQNILESFLNIHIKSQNGLYIYLKQLLSNYKTHNPILRITYSKIFMFIFNLKLSYIENLFFGKSAQLIIFKILVEFLFDENDEIESYDNITNKKSSKLPFLNLDGGEELDECFYFYTDEFDTQDIELISEFNQKFDINQSIISFFIEFKKNNPEYFEECSKMLNQLFINKINDIGI